VENLFHTVSQATNHVIMSLKYFSLSKSSVRKFHAWTSGQLRQFTYTQPYLHHQFLHSLSIKKVRHPCSILFSVIDFPVLVTYPALACRPAKSLPR